MKKILFAITLSTLSFIAFSAQTGDCTMGSQYCEGNSLNTVNTTTTTNTNTNNNTNNNTNINTNTNNNTNTNVSTNSNTNTNANTNINTSTSTVNSTASQTVTNTNTNTNTNNSTNNNTSTSTSSVSTNNQNVNTNNNTAVNTNNNTSTSTQKIEQDINSPPASAIAPSIMSYSQDLCTTGVSGAFQGQLFGLSGGKSIRDENCERLKLSKYLYDRSMKVASVSILCQDSRVFKAMRHAGTPCPYMGLIGDEAKIAWKNNKKSMPTYKEDRAMYMSQCVGNRHVTGKYKGKRKSKRTCEKEFNNS
jgi:hypothetical protein